MQAGSRQCDYHGHIPVKNQVRNCFEGKTIDRCEFCGRQKSLTEHHLIPRAVHSKRKYLEKYGKLEMQNRKVMLCKLCHDGIHDLIDEKELAESFTTAEELLADERVQKHLAWVRKQK